MKYKIVVKYHNLANEKEFSQEADGVLDALQRVKKDKPKALRNAVKVTILREEAFKLKEATDG